jgi:hypothetical protein
MSVSLREIYDKIQKNSNEDISIFSNREDIDNSYRSLEMLRSILNVLNQERELAEEGVTLSCSQHSSFNTEDIGLDLSKLDETVDRIKPLRCSSVQRKDCTCQALSSCECNTRTLTCDEVVTYSSSVLCSSRTTAEVSCQCNTQSGSNVYYYVYYYTYSYVTGYYTYSYYYSYVTYSYYISLPSGSTCIVGGSSGSTISGTAYAVGTSYAYATGSATGTGYYYYNTAVCASRTTYSTSCECNSRTTVNPCTCNTRSEALCPSRTTCSCDTVCTCDTVKEFGYYSSNMSLRSKSR